MMTSIWRSFLQPDAVNAGSRPFAGVDCGPVSTVSASTASRSSAAYPTILSATIALASTSSKVTAAKSIASQPSSTAA